MEEISDRFFELSQLEGARIAEKFRNPSQDGQWARLDADPALDRYHNIHPWANNRVHLKVPEGYNDYINASPITLDSESDTQEEVDASAKARYICMQGPKKETVDHVWHSK
jgi:protein-tyrosine phosphatase